MNFQNIPRGDDRVKRAFIPKLDCLLFADYSQIEYRLFALYMARMVDDWRAVELFQSGRDFHEETAKRMLDAVGREYNDPLEDDERQIGKTGNFAAIYGGGVPTYQRQLGCDKGTARELADAFHEQYPLLGRSEWVRGRRRDPAPHTLNGQLAAEYRINGCVRTLWGRELHPSEDRKILNSLCQGGAADLIKLAMLNVEDQLLAHGFRSHMVLSTHDEIGLDCVEDERPFIMDNLRDWMADEYMEQTIRMEVDMKISYTNWAEAEGL